MEEKTNLNVLEIPVPEKLVDYFQMLDFEIAGLQVLHTHALNAGVSEEKCEKIKNDYLEKYKELQLLKAETEKEYLANIPFTSWNLIYNRGIIYVTTN